MNFDSLKDGDVFTIPGYEGLFVKKHLVRDFFQVHSFETGRVVTEPKDLTGRTVKVVNKFFSALEDLRATLKDNVLIISRGDGYFQKFVIDRNVWKVTIPFYVPATLSYYGVEEETVKQLSITLYGTIIAKLTRLGYFGFSVRSKPIIQGTSNGKYWEIRESGKGNSYSEIP